MTQSSLLLSSLCSSLSIVRRKRLQPLLRCSAAAQLACWLVSLPPSLHSTLLLDVAACSAAKGSVCGMRGVKGESASGSGKRGLSLGSLSDLGDWVICSSFLNEILDLANILVRSSARPKAKAAAACASGGEWRRTFASCVSSPFRSCSPVSVRAL